MLDRLHRSVSLFSLVALLLAGCGDAEQPPVSSRGGAGDAGAAGQGGSGGEGGEGGAISMGGGGQGGAAGAAGSAGAGGEVGGGGSTAVVPEDELPYGGKFYGAGVGLHTLSHLQIRTHVISKRFEAPRSGKISAVRWNLLHTRPDDLTDSGELKAYSKGDGGRIKLTLQASRADGMPSGEALATTKVYGPFLDKQGKLLTSNNPVWDFEEAATLEKGKVYHLVWENVAANRQDNFVTTADYAFYSQQPAPEVAAGPFFGEGFIVFKDDQELKRWPKFDLHYDDGFIWGTGYGFGHAKLLRTFGGEARVRELFTVSGSRTTPAVDRKVDGLFARVLRTTAATKPLVVRLLDEQEHVLAEASAPSSAVPINDPAIRPANWVHLDLSKAVTLKAGATYTAELSSAGTGYQIQPAVKATGSIDDFFLDAQYSDLNQWHGGHAQINGDGAAWTDWDCGPLKSGPNKDMDLPLLFTVER